MSGKGIQVMTVAALELAREYRDRALMDREYFINSYAGDMELENIYAEAKKRLI